MTHRTAPLRASRRSDPLRAACGAVLAALLLAACSQGPEEPPPPSSPPPSATAAGAAPAQGGINFCDLVTQQELTAAAATVGFDGDVVLYSRAVRVFEDPAREDCDYRALGTGDAETAIPFVISVYPDGAQVLSKGVPEGAEPLPELGEGAWFDDRNDRDQGFVLLAAAKGAAFELVGFLPVEDAAVAEEALTGLFRTAADRLPDGAALEGLVAQGPCRALTDAATVALGAPPRFSRSVASRGAVTCQYAATANRGDVSAEIHPEAGWERDFADDGTKVDGLPDAWLAHGQVIVFEGGNVVEVQVIRGSEQTEAGDAELAKDVTFAAEAMRLLAG